MPRPQPPAATTAPPPPRGIVGLLRSPSTLVAIAVLIVGSSTLFWFQTRRPAASPAERQARALEWLDEGGTNERRRARSVALGLRDSGYRDPEFGGAIEFVLGIAAFREARDADDLAGDETYLEVIQLLRDAERRALVADRRPEWAYAMGVSLARIGAVVEAGPYLVEATAALEANADRWLGSLIGAALETGRRELLESLLAANERALAGEDDLAVRDERLLQRAQLLFALDRPEEAEAALVSASETGRRGDDAVLFRGRSLYVAGRHAEAIEMLKPLAERNDEGRRSTVGTYISGLAAEAAGDVDNAIRHYDAVADRAADAHEGLAGRMRAADLFRRAGRREESLEAFRRVLSRIPRADRFRNRWLSLEEFRRIATDGWNALLDDEAYAEAIELATLLDPLFPTAAALEFEARAAKRWAEDDQRRYDDANWSRRRTLRTTLLQRWGAAGEAYARLAEELRTTTEYGPVLYEAADHHSRGHDFATALALLDRFIETRPRELLPEAQLRRARALFDLGRIEDALVQYEQIVERFPTTPTSYEAQFEIGRCHHELDQPDAARRDWIAILESPRFGPSATVWRESLIGLARLSYHRARAAHRESLAPEVEADTAGTLRAEAYAAWDDAIARLQEYLQRYGGGAESAEARFLLARALLDRADEPRRALRSAETENTRLELRRRIDRLLERSIVEYRTLQDVLLPLEVDDRLDPVRAEFLESAMLDVAQAHYELGRDEQAIAAFAAAANRSPEDARVLVCYVQMANAYDRLGRPVEARSMLQQARLILQRMPDSSFEADTTSLDRDGWQRWIEWARARGPAAGNSSTPTNATTSTSFSTSSTDPATDA